MKEKGCLFLPLLFCAIRKVLASAIRQEEEIQCIKIGKNKVRLSLFTDIMTVCIENAKESSPPIVPGVVLDTGVTNDRTRYSQSCSRWGITMENNRYRRGKVQ